MRYSQLILVDLFEGTSKDELIKNIEAKKEKRYLEYVLDKMHELVKDQGNRQSIGGSAFDISRFLGGAISGRELERLYRKKYMDESMLEWGRVVKNVNTTVDVGTDEIKKQAAKFGNTVDKDGRPPTHNKKVKGSKTNVLGNLGLAERYTPMEIALIEGGHTFEDLADLKPLKEKQRKTSKIFETLLNLVEDIAPHGSPQQEAELMIAGKKPAALTYEQDFLKHFQTPAEMYDWVVVKFDPPNSSFSKYAVAQPGEEERANLIAKLVTAANQNNFKFQSTDQEIRYHQELGRLLGYSEADIKDFIKSKVLKEEYDSVDAIFLSEAMNDYIKFGNKKFQEPDAKHKVDGIILGSKHYGDRESQRLIFAEQTEIGRMFSKFIKDPISSKVTNADPEEGFSFCLYNDENLGVALQKREFMFDDIDDFFTGYLVTTVHRNLLPYSNQQLFRVPNDPNEPCRLFNEEDLETLTPQQRRAISRRGRFAR